MRLTEKLEKLRRARRRAVPKAPPPCVGCHGDRDRLEPVEVGDIDATTVDSVVGPVDTVQVAAIDDALVVLHPATGRRVLLNPTGALIFTAVATERPVADVIDQLAEETGGAAAAITADVLATLDRLIGQGLLTRDDLIDPAADDEPEGVDDVDPAPVTDATVEPVGPRRWAYRSGVRAAAGATISVRAEPMDLVDSLDAALAGFPDASADASDQAADVAPARSADAPGGSADASAVGRASADRAHAMADHRIDLVVAGDPGDPDAVRLVVDDDAPSGPLARDVAVARVFDRLDVLLAEAPRALAFHAGAVERDGEVIVLLGRSGDGKSTLTAALAQAGWRYITDELVVIDPASNRVHPYPRPFDLDASARSALGLDAADMVTGGPKDKVLATRLGTVSTGGTPALLVLLTGRVAADAAETVPPPEALMGLLPLTFERTFDDPEALAHLARLCETTRTVRVARAPLDTMIATILDSISS